MLVSQALEPDSNIMLSLVTSFAQSLPQNPSVNLPSTFIVIFPPVLNRIPALFSPLQEYVPEFSSNLNGLILRRLPVCSILSDGCNRVPSLYQENTGAGLPSPLHCNVTLEPSSISSIVAGAFKVTLVDDDIPV